MTHLISVVTGLPPKVDGIGDFALTLARKSRDDFGLDTRFIVGNPKWEGPQSAEGFLVSRLAERSRKAFLNLLEQSPAGADAILLHYGGYGYATRGCPVWLVDALQHWRDRRRERFLMTFFHELYASGPPWTSAFWLSPMQRNLAARLATLSDKSVTSIDRYARVIRRIGTGKHAESESLPVFSSIGEPGVTLPLAERSKRLIVFGTYGRRKLVYERSAAALNRVCEALEIEEILDIGRALDPRTFLNLTAPVTPCGELPGAEISRLLSNAVAGVIDYPAALLGKSTIFAAYCAHRLIPIVASYGEGPPEDGLEANTHYWTADSSPCGLEISAGQEIADSACAWYQAHNLSVHSRAMAACLNGNGVLAKGDAGNAKR